MKILAIETTGQSGSIALLDGTTLARKIMLPAAERSAKTLAPAIREILDAAGWRPADIRLIAVATGPGSFTGLRVGVTTAKTFAYAMRADVIGVNTLEVIAAQTPDDIERVSAVVDAQRKQVFVREFVRDSTRDFQPIADAAILDNDTWLAGINPATSVSGPGLEKLAAQIPAGVTIVAREYWSPRAATVGQLGWRRYRSGARDDLWRIVPQYFRPSAAEEKWAERQR
jgi:tRNA threonylcarbamoyladenosine biosynthesis protein TsaB